MSRFIPFNFRHLFVVYCIVFLYLKNKHRKRGVRSQCKEQFLVISGFPFVKKKKKDKLLELLTLKPQPLHETKKMYLFVYLLIFEESLFTVTITE